jgi:hypothetical protein
MVRGIECFLGGYAGEIVYNNTSFIVELLTTPEN